MKKLNVVLLVCTVSLFMACESNDSPELENAVPLATEIGVPVGEGPGSPGDPTPTDLCDLPEIPETCPADLGAPGTAGVTAVPVDIMGDFGYCLDEAWSDPDLAPFEYEGEVYEYVDAGTNDPTAILSITAVTFHYITELDALNTTAKDPGFATKFFRCVVKIIGVDDIKKLLKHYRNGRLTKKMLWRIVKRQAIRKFGWVGAAISFCEFISCMAK
ncbi:hypothetical protein [Spongiimicrobium salis]|uniref:hypothetical protein n=1 Tax=Spongiimicrobium salis TaxID=1667022 RepID=UPI00374D15E7